MSASQNEPKTVLVFRVEGNPVPYVRQTQRDKWDTRPSVERYRVWADLIRYTFKPLALGGQPTILELPALGPVHLSCVFDLPVPASWPKWRKQEALAGTSWPIGHSSGDADNYAKGVADSLNQLAWLDDSQLISVSATKRYSATPGALIVLDFDPARWVKTYAAGLVDTWEQGMGRAAQEVMPRSTRNTPRAH